MRTQLTSAALGMLFAICITPSRVDAATLASDSFVVPPYATGDLTPQNPVVTGFTGAWQDGTTATATYTIQADGLDHPVSLGEAGGRVQYSGFNGLRRVSRDLSFIAPSSPTTYYFSGQARLDGNASTTSGGLSIAGFVGDTSSLTDTQFFANTGTAINSAIDVQGLMFGFQGDGSNVDFVLRHRADPNPAIGNQGQQQVIDTLINNVTSGDVIQWVAKIEQDSEGTITTGNDRVSIWLNPDSPTEAGNGLPDFVFIDFSLSAPNAIQELVFGNNNIGNQVSFDELRFGTTFEDVFAALAVPEPASLVVWTLLGTIGLAYAIGRRCCCRA